MTIKYAIRDKKTKKLFGLSIRSNSDRDYCNDVSVYFQIGDDYTTALFETLDEAKKAISINTPLYNSDIKRPNWGYYKKEQFELVECEIIVKTINDVTYEQLKLEDALTIDWDYENKLFGIVGKVIDNRPDWFKKYIGKTVYVGDALSKIISVLDYNKTFKNVLIYKKLD